MKTTIIGAGICGLWLGHQLKQQGHDVTIFEKSKGVGGRMATKRTGTETFDHGAQFYSDDPEMNQLHKIWSSSNLSRPWFSKNDRQRFTAIGGMTLLAKKLQQNLEVQLNQKLNRIFINDGLTMLEFEDGPKINAEVLVLTCPLPQTLEILDLSGLEYPSELKQIQYEKAIVFLIEGVLTQSQAMNGIGYVEPEGSADIFSITDQQKKQTCVEPCWTIAMSESFSERYFECSDDVILDAGIKAIRIHFPDFLYKNTVVKKWRFSHPKSKYQSAFLKLKGLPVYLAGDAFGGPSITGTVRSANALLVNL